MSKLVFAINVTIDGCCDHTRPNPDAEVHDYFTALNREADVTVFGRKTYELMVPFWPDVAKKPTGDKGMDDFAQSFISIPRMIVVSRTLATPEQKNTTVIRSNLQAEIQKLKQESGKSILCGGVDVPSQLMQAGLVDEIRLVVHPVVTGKGRRLFEDIDLEKNFGFKLVDTKLFKSGSIALRFGKE